MSDNQMLYLAVGEGEEEQIFPVVDEKAVHFDGPQELSSEEQAQARANMGINLFAYNFTTVCEAPKVLEDETVEYDYYNNPQDAEAIERIAHHWQEDPMSVYIQGYPVIGVDINNHHLKILWNDRYIYTFNWWVDGRLENVSLWPHSVATLAYNDEVKSSVDRLAGSIKKYIDEQDASAVRYTTQIATPEQQAQARTNVGAASADTVAGLAETVEKLTKASTFEGSGMFAFCAPGKNSKVNVVSQITREYDTPRYETRLILHQVSSNNLTNVFELFGEPGTVIEKNGLKATVNADYTLTITGTSTSSGWTEFAVDPIGTDYDRMLPPGTYTVPSGLTIGIGGVYTGSNNISYGNKQGTFTMDVPFYLNKVYVAFAGGATVNKTVIIGLFEGGSVPDDDWVYSGQSYTVDLGHVVMSGSYDWDTGKLYDDDGQMVGTYTAFGITAMDGVNRFWTGWGENTVSGYLSVAGCGGSGSVEVFNPTEWGLPVLRLSGETNNMSKNIAVTLAYEYGELSGTCSCKWQGSSSISYPKKNYTIEFDKAFEAAEGWGEQRKYCFKANYIDHSHARNLVNAKLWGEIVKSRSSVPSVLSGLVNYGAVDGFPVIILLNEEFHGLYTLNIPKDAWMFGMGNGTKECILCAGNACDANGFKAPATLTTDLEIEYITDENNTAWAVTSVNNLIDACINSNGTDLDTTIAAMLDWQSAIDYYIFTVLIEGFDMTLKNYILATFDGTKWYFSAYDMDSTYGLWWNGQYFVATNANPTFVSFAGQHRVMELIKAYKKDALKARYAQLRETVLSESNLATVLNNFIGKIPSPVYMQDVKKWPLIPNTSVNNASQIRDYYRMRVAYVDKWIESL